MTSVNDFHTLWVFQENGGGYHRVRFCYPDPDICLSDPPSLRSSMSTGVSPEPYVLGHGCGGPAYDCYAKHDLLAVSAFCRLKKEKKRVKNNNCANLVMLKNVKFFLAEIPVPVLKLLKLGPTIPFRFCCESLDSDLTSNLRTREFGIYYSWLAASWGLFNGVPCT